MFRGPDPKSQHKKITHFSGHQKLEFHSNDQGWLQIMGLVIWKGLTFPSRISNQKCETMVINQLPSKHSTTCNLKMTWLFQKGIFQGVQFFWSSILNFKGMYSTIKPSNISNKLGCFSMSKKTLGFFHPQFFGSRALVMRLPVRHLFQSFATDWEKLTKIRLEMESLEKLNHNTTPYTTNSQSQPLKTRPKMTPKRKLYSSPNHPWLLVSGRERYKWSIYKSLYVDHTTMILKTQGIQSTYPGLLWISSQSLKHSCWNFRRTTFVRMKSAPK